MPPCSPACSRPLPLAPARADGEKFTLARYVPADVFVYVATQHNPERQFLESYWQDVFQALRESGVGNDVLELIGSAVNPEQKEEVDRIRQRASELIAGVDWSQLVAREMVFAERMPDIVRRGEHDISVGPPDMAWLFRGTAETARPNYEGCVAILRALGEEINKAAGSEGMQVVVESKHGCEVASLNLVALIQGGRRLPADGRAARRSGRHHAGATDRGGGARPPGRRQRRTQGAGGFAAFCAGLHRAARCRRHDVLL